MNTPHLDELRDKVKRLKDLLDDPQPGLFTWRETYRQAVIEVLEFYGVATESSTPKTEHDWNLSGR